MKEAAQRLGSLFFIRRFWAGITIKDVSKNKGMLRMWQRTVPDARRQPNDPQQ
jgi:hypothetical protein